MIKKISEIIFLKENGEEIDNKSIFCSCRYCTIGKADYQITEKNGDIWYACEQHKPKE